VSPIIKEILQQQGPISQVGGYLLCSTRLVYACASAAVQAARTNARLSASQTCHDGQAAQGEHTSFS
jgi:hypothetical protein